MSALQLLEYLFEEMSVRSAEQQAGPFVAVLSFALRSCTFRPAHFQPNIQGLSSAAYIGKPNALGTLPTPFIPTLAKRFSPCLRLPFNNGNFKVEGSCLLKSG